MTPKEDRASIAHKRADHPSLATEEAARKNSGETARRERKSKEAQEAAESAKETKKPSLHPEAALEAQEPALQRGPPPEERGEEKPGVPPRVGVIIPTYNHDATLPAVLEGVWQQVEEVIVVDDGSTDETPALLAELTADKVGTEVLRLPHNQGKGKALLQGMARGLARGWEAAITLDADGQHDPADIPTFLEAVAQEPAAIFVGSRAFAGEEHVPLKSRMGRAFSNFWLRVIAGQPLPDSQSGYRCYPLRHVLQLGCRTGRFEFEIEVLVRAAWAGLDLIALPVRVYYPPPEKRVSHFRTVRDFLRISLLNTFLFFRMLVPFGKKKLDLEPPLPLRERIRRFLRQELLESGKSNAELAVAIGFGVFMGIVPIWGYQMLVGLYLAHVFRLNKLVVLAASNISIPPMPIFITMASIWLGHLLLTGETAGAFRGDFTSFHDALYFAQKSLGAWLLGSMALAVGAGLSLGALSYPVLRLVRRQRNQHQR